MGQLNALLDTSPLSFTVRRNGDTNCNTYSFLLCKHCFNYIILRLRPANKLYPLHVCGAQLFTAPHRPDQSLENWIFICAALSLSLSLPHQSSPSLSDGAYAISVAHRCLVAAKSIVAPPTNSSRPSFDKHKHKLNQYPWIGQ